MIKTAIFTILSLLFIFLPAAGAAEVIDAPPPTTTQSSPLIITAYQSSHSVHFVQIYNNSDTPFLLDNWMVEALLHDGSQEVEQSLASLSGWIAPRDYILISDGSINGSDIVFTNPLPTSGQSVLKIILKHNQYALQEAIPVTHLQNEFMQRNKTTSGAFSTASQPFSKAVFNDSSQLYGHGYYELPNETSLQIVEILPNSRDCSPAEADTACGDYIKVYNPTNQTIVLDDFSLRAGYKGQSSSVSNSFSMTGDLAPGEYETINLRNDNALISLTNTGGFAWIEDVYGLKSYDNTIVEYPDASSTTKKGASWAYNSTENIWKWGVPSPGGANTFPEEIEVGGSGSGGSGSLKPCRADQFRNPETNRCKLISSTSSVLKPCRDDQYRNPETNRCKSIASASSTLKPCAADQYRNPETNRCKKISSSTSSLKPCKPNQERNLGTNRCRKVVKNTAVAGAVDEIPQDSASSKNLAPWLIGLAGGGVVLYGIYEWRTEITEATLRLRDAFGKGGPPGE